MFKENLLNKTLESMPHSSNRSGFIYNPPEHTGLDVLYEDESMLIFNKPHGLLSVRGRGVEHQDSLISRVELEYPDAIVVHRLDMATSGIMLMARGKAMERVLSKSFQSREVTKKYYAIVAGKLAQQSGEIDLPLIVDWENRPRQMVCHTRGKSAQTLYQVLAYHADQDVTEVELTPITGRSHQLRVHMQALGHAILGDEFYALPERKLQAPRLLLHACQIEIPHPETGAIISITNRIDFMPNVAILHRSE